MEMRNSFQATLLQVFDRRLRAEGNFAIVDEAAANSNQQQTNDVFSEKWSEYGRSGEREAFYRFQRQWYLKLYGFDSEDALRAHLQQCDVILDAGCGLGYKAAWFAQLAPHALVIGMDYSTAAQLAAYNYSDLPNLFFVRGDISRTSMHDGCVDYVNCDQAIMHTEAPVETFGELVRLARRPHGQVACYFYSRKALPRELLDDYFRAQCKRISTENLWEFAEQLAELGKCLSALDVKFECPEIPLLGIKGGVYDIQRFLYWNFLKCFWNEGLGRETSVMTNFDWYSPSNAHRFSEGEVRDLVASNGMFEIFFNVEDACFSGRFGRTASLHEMPLS